MGVLDSWIGTTTNWGTAGNWSNTTVPANTDTVLINAVSSQSNIDAGLAQSAVTLAVYSQDMSYIGLIGTPQSGGTSTGYLAIGSTVFYFGTPSVTGQGNGSRRTNVSAVNSGAIINILNTGATANDIGATPLLLKTNAAVMNCSGGISGVALYPGETATIATLNMVVGAGAPSVMLGGGCTLTTGTILGGTLNNGSSAASTVTVRFQGSLLHTGTGGYTSLTISDGRTVTYNGTGTITALVFGGPSCVLDFSQGTGTVTITNTTGYSKCQIKDPLKRVTYTNPPGGTNVNGTQFL